MEWDRGDMWWIALKRVSKIFGLSRCDAQREAKSRGQLVN